MSSPQPFISQNFDFTIQALTTEDEELTFKNVVQLQKDGKEVYPVTHNKALIGGYSNKAYNINDSIYLNDWNNVVDNGLYYSDTNSQNCPSIDSDVGPCNVFIRVSAIQGRFVLQETVIDNRFDYFPANDDYYIGDENYSGYLLGYLGSRYFRLGIYNGEEIEWKEWKTKDPEPKEPLYAYESYNFYENEDEELGNIFSIKVDMRDRYLESKYDLYENEIIFVQCAKYMSPENFQESYNNVYITLSTENPNTWENSYVHLQLITYNEELNDYTTEIPTSWMRPGAVFGIVKCNWNWDDYFKLVPLSGVGGSSSASAVTINRWEDEA